MIKKIIYAIVAVIVGFVVFYVSWKDAYSTAVVNRGNKALEEGNYEFFLKFLDYYEKEPIDTITYLENNNTTTVRLYNVFSKSANDADGKKVNRSGVMFLITDLNLDVIVVDESEPATEVKDEDPATRVTFTADNTATYSYVISTYAYSSAPVILYTISTTEFKEEFVTETITTAPTSITHIKIVDSEGNAMLDNNVNIPLVEQNEEDYWKQLVEDGNGGVGFTDKEYRNNFSFAFPEMRKAFIITAVAMLILLGLGVFIFWPKKSYVPKENEDREKYTFASTEEKEKTAIEKVARGKKEKEERENRYKNVRKENNLEDITDNAIEESMDKENTFEKAIEEDKALEPAMETTNEEAVEKTLEVAEEKKDIEE